MHYMAKAKDVQKMKEKY
jgi:hypothetical protein